MSRCYEMQITIEKYDVDKVSEVMEAAIGEWGSWNNGECYNNTLTAYGEGSLCGGEDEDEFVQRVSLAVWKANGAFCQVSVRCTFLEELPNNLYSLDETEYADLMKPGPKTYSSSCVECGAHLIGFQPRGDNDMCQECADEGDKE